MKNSEYWQKRFSQLEAAQNSIGADSLTEIERQYREAQKQLEGQISAWYQRFADNNGISMAEARQWLTGADLKEFKWSVQDYIKAGEENAVSGQWMKQLENASAKFHISKLEALKTHTQQSLEVMFSKQLGTVSSTMQDVIESGYLHTAYELQSGFEVGWDITGLDQTEIESLLSKPWAADGYNFSERIWNNKDKLISEIHTELTRNVMLGNDPQQAIDAIAKKMNTSKTNAGRLVMTEEAYFSSVAQKNCFEELGVEQYEIVATLDSHTSDICQSMDGQVFPMKDFQAGVTAPPFHVNCRSTTVPYFDDNFGQIGERAAKDEEGNTYYVPEDMKYQDWKETFVDGGDKSGFDVITQQGGTTAYVHHTEPEAEKPKKEYLTEKKLQAKIADADVQIEDLQEQQKIVSGYTGEEVIADFGSIEEAYEGETSAAALAEKAKMLDLQSQIEQLEQQKAEWETKLQEKLVAEQKKALTKQQLELEAKKAALQQQLDDMEIKTYSGIWKGDVTTADWENLNIAGKKQYYEGKFITETDPDLMQKYQDLYKQLDELDTEGKSYYEVQQEIKKIEQEMKKVQADLTQLENGGIIDAVDDAYTQARKDAAYWFTDKSAADAVLRPTSGEVWRNATAAQRSAAYKYTSGSGGFNRPLRGYGRNWYSFKGVGNVDLNNEGCGNAIKRLTEIIDDSTYDFDIWLNRGVETSSGAASFLQISESTLRSASQSELEQMLLGKVIKDEAFVSCGSAKGTGFNGYIFNVYAPKGTKMLYAEPFSCYGSGAGANWDGISGQTYFGHEFETIIQKGTEFRITKVEKSGGNLYFDIEVVGQP